MNTKILEKIGFTNGEIKVYFALLTLGNTTSGPIITKSKVSRSKVYDILEKLKQKGLVTELIRENIKYFQTASPNRILDYIQTKENEIEQDKEEFKKILPQLLLQEKLIQEKQEVRVYIGYEGVKTFYNEILETLKKGEEYCAMTFSDKYLENKSIVLFFQKFHQKRAELGIKAKILCNLNEYETQKKMDYSNTSLYEFKTTEQLLPTGIAIFKDTVATFIWGETPRVFSVICKENAEQYKKFFYSIWDKSKNK